MKATIITGLGSLNTKFIIINIIGFLIMIGGVSSLFYFVYSDSPDRSIIDFNSAFVDSARFVNKNTASCEEYLNNVAELNSVNAAVIDETGQILLKSKKVKVDKFDMEKLYKWFHREYEDGNFYQMYDITIDNKSQKLLVYREYSTLYKLFGENGVFLVLIIPVIAAMFFIYFLTNKEVKYVKTIAKGAGEFSKGNLDYRIKKKGRDELGILAETLNDMAEKLKENMEKERAQERFRTELITNVSHDLRTPLTSLIAYLQLVENKKTNEESRDKYTAISLEKAYKLKQLIEDLFEYSKIESGGISLEKSEANMVEILEQSIGELFIDAQKRNMNFIKEFEISKIILNVDSSKIGRVFENILSNAVKYGVKGTNVYINLIEHDEYETIIFTNEVSQEISENTLKFFDRFYRGDESRNSRVKGSGLGLAISKNIIELHKGEIWSESEKNIFKIYVKLYRN